MIESLKLCEESLTGRLYDKLYSRNLIMQGWVHFYYMPVNLVIMGIRAVAVAALAVTTVLDLACLIGMTITVYPAYRMGREHLANLIFVASFPLFALKILFQCPTNRIAHRGFFNPKWTSSNELSRRMIIERQRPVVVVPQHKDYIFR